MVCKYCNAEIGEGRRFCPECGKPLTEEAQIPEIGREEAAEAAEVREAAEITEAAEIKETTTEPKSSQKPTAKKGETGKLVLLIAGLVAVVGILAVVLLQSFGISLFEQKAPEEDPVTEEEDVYIKEVYNVEDAAAIEAADTVVARIGDNEIDNALISVYLTEEFKSFITNYYDYLSYVGLDLSVSPAEQTCYFDATMTWEQFMLQASFESWQSYVYMAMLADQNGFTLNAEYQSLLDGMEASLEKDAVENGYENADALLKEQYGAACTVDVYVEYVEQLFYANAYYADALEFTDEQISAAFDENEAALAEDGVTKTSALRSSVRHLLVMPEGGTVDEDGQTTYSEEEWNTCLANAEKLLQEWKDGEATEESFSALVAEHTDDTASASTGGLYEDILNDGTYMEEFQDWAIDTQRQPGDTGIVRTSAGYHIMYFVEGEPEWLYYAESILQKDRLEELDR